MTFDERVKAASAAGLGVVLVAILLAVLDPFARHGWTASWFVTEGGHRVEMVRTTEHRVAFPTDQRPLARYVERWDFARFGVPENLPTLDATLRARILVPNGGRIFTARSNEQVQVRVDGLAMGSAQRVAAGWHRVEVDWRGSFRPDTSLELQWGPAPGVLDPVPSSAIVPEDGSWPPWRIALWIAALVSALLLGAQLARIARADGLARTKRWAQLATALIVVLGLAYRAFDYDVMPDYRENDDERFATWNGFSLLQDGTTRGMTMWWGEYMATGHGRIERAPYFGRQPPYHMVTPYFEHPPLLHALVGLAGHLGGAHEYREVRLMHARLVPIALSVVTLLLMIAIGRRLDPGSPAPWLGALLWAALPWIALQTRVVKEEALVTPLALAGVLFFLRWRQDRRRRDLVLAAIAMGLCPLAKVTGIAYALALWILVAAEGKARDIAIAVLVSLGVASLLLVFGAAIDWGSFLYAQQLQTTRAVHFNIFLRFFDDGLINHNLIGRGWLMFLWLAAMAGLAKRGARDVAVYAVPTVCYLALIALGSGSWTFGWYVMPLLPLVCLAAGRYLADLWRAPDLWRGSIFVFVLVFYSLNFLIDPQVPKMDANVHWVRLLVSAVLVGSLAPFALVQAFKNSMRGFARVAIAAGLAVVVVIGGLFVVRYETMSNVYRDFDRDRFFDR